VLNELRVGEFLAALGERTPTPASGAATALTAALAAALAELAARFVDDEDADADASAYTAFMAERSDETRARIIEVPEAIAAQADEIAALADDLAGRLSTSVRGDAEASAELARAAARVGRRLAELNRR